MVDPFKDRLRCESPSEVEILISGNTAKPTERYFDNKCKYLKGKKKEECYNTEFTLIKATDKGINFSSSKLLDSLSCSEENGKSNAISLSGFYPNIKASFNCQAQGLSRVEKGICNSAEAVGEDSRAISSATKRVISRNLQIAFLLL
ncbi:hypothetical protein CQA49_07965 [Helicobacter sp. MIT 00-7814]|uniref:hypothetical protein n=1 Tax=unclassified Helicobacter TaxID=2593540 RepID=UPI000E1E7CDA|nr:MULTISPECIES: hypothetical protein [unclassified Helicobacter]RDU52624.1 hypothetical protein CQA49_07965 [Helicobacter sp. MIT 00-7814]RDU55919.1 hypothetical protein CQA37_03225 [Helicobacter sp. MIT 99-10781]